MAATGLQDTQPEPKPFNPWTFIPLLYFMQAIPVAVVQELSIVIFKDLGLATEQIARWTALIALPWGLQMLLGPFVDLNATKRRWILGGQAVIAGFLVVLAFVLRLPNAFGLSLAVMGLAAVMSALTNIATDGFALLSMTKNQQAAMAGFMSTCYRLGRMFCVFLLAFIAGKMMELAPLRVDGAELSFKRDGQIQTATGAHLVIREGMLADPRFGMLEPPVPVPPGTYRLKLQPDGVLMATTLAGTKPIGAIPAAGQEQEVVAKDPQTTWSLVILFGALVYLVGWIVNHFAVPRPPKDVRATGPPGESARNLIRTFALLGLGIGGYFLLNSVVRLVAHALWRTFDGTVKPPDQKDFERLQGWRLPDDNKIPFLNDLSFGPIGTEVFQFVLCAVVVVASVVLWRRSIAGSAMGEAIVSYVRQPGFLAILLFVAFYRLPEAMISRITPLFLKDTLDKGGLAVSNHELGFLTGVLGVVGLLIGGITGGLIVSRIGLKRAFIPLALALHVPNVLYLALAMRALPSPITEVPGFGALHLTVGVTIFFDQFGYGFGFAAYMVYIMWVAQRGNYPTSHYAIGTGLGALTIAMAGVLSGTLYKAFEAVGYVAVFIAVIVLAVPGMLSILFVPLDDSHRKIKAEVPD